MDLTQKIVKELQSIDRLEKGKNRAKKNYEMYAKLLRKCKDVLPLIEEIAALQIGPDELIAVKAGISQAVKLYNLPPLAATLRLLEDIRCSGDTYYGTTSRDHTLRVSVLKYWK